METKHLSCAQLVHLDQVTVREKSKTVIDVLKVFIAQAMRLLSQKCAQLGHTVLKEVFNQSIAVLGSIVHLSLLIKSYVLNLSIAQGKVIE